MATSKNPTPYKFPCLVVTQNKYQLVCFIAKSKTIWRFVDINRRDTDKDESYQRALSQSRVNTVAKFIDEGNAVPNSILISLDEGAKLSSKKDSVIIPKKSNAGWVIDGQHRLAGAKESGRDIEFAVLAFIGLDLNEQIHQFVTINREAKGVPTSLYYDLLKRLPPNRSESEVSKERAVDIADSLKKNSESPFYHRIVISPPKVGEMSLTQFVRKVAPLVIDKKGFFHTYGLLDQIGIIDNYYRGLKNVFPQYFDSGKQIFFRTLGFGAMINALSTVFSLSLREHKGFRVEDVSRVLKKVEDFEFSVWEKAGTGVQAEGEAGEDFRQTLLLRFQSTESEASSVRLS